MKKKDFDRLAGWNDIDRKPFDLEGWPEIDIPEWNKVDFSWPEFDLDFMNIDISEWNDISTAWPEIDLESDKDGEL